MYKLLLLFCLYIPFQIALNPAEGVDLASGRVFILILALTWLISALKNRRLCVPARIQTFLIASFLFLNAFSLLWARNSDWGLRKLLFLLSLFPIYFIVADILSATTLSERSESKGGTKIVKCLVWGAGLAALVGLIQFSLQFVWGLNNVLKFWAGSVAPIFLGTAFSQAVLAYPSWLVNLGGKTIFRAISTFPDPHMFSIYLGMALPLALGLSFSGKKKIYLILLLVILLADLLTFSRGGYIGLASGLMFFVIFIVWSKKIKIKKVLAGFALGIVFLIFILNSPIGNRFLTSFNAKEGSNQGRLEMWKEAVDIIESNPLGVGLGNYALEIKATADYREPFYAHNFYLDIAAETGIINAIIWIALIVFSISALTLNPSPQRGEGNLRLGMAVSLVIFSAHSLFETALFSVQALPFLLIIIALSASFKDEE
jgi:O-antigen ligase